ncbi:Metallo-dependent phosphatase-like protein [Phellopilus nigrolimitatus]|nr:Metallo-dependent phosphatase-like protein [Phellopilus nigrolimitatus]
MSATSAVYTSYPSDEPPTHPGKGWSRFVCISDSHSSTYYSVPPGDVLIHAGDLSSWGTYKYLRKTVDWLTEMPHGHKIIIAGNHDLSLDLNWRRTEENDTGLDTEEVDASLELMRSDYVRDAGIIYLDHQQTEISTPHGTRWKVYGSPAAPFYVPGAFQYASREEANAEWSQIPLDVEILLTHTPPFGILDTTRRGKNAGCADLSARIDALECCRLHVFGHIHEAHGANVRTPAAYGREIELVSVNAALFNDDQAVIVDLKKDTSVEQRA